MYSLNLTIVIFNNIYVYLITNKGIALSGTLILTSTNLLTSAYILNDTTIIVFTNTNLYYLSYNLGSSWNIYYLSSTI